MPNSRQQEAQAQTQASVRSLPLGPGLAVLVPQHLCHQVAKARSFQERETDRGIRGLTVISRTGKDENMKPIGGAYVRTAEWIPAAGLLALVTRS